MTSYILKTNAGAAVMAFDSLNSAIAARDSKQCKYPKPMQIVRRRIVEELVG